MPSDSKIRRQLQADYAAKLKRAKETNALCVAALRAASARAVLMDELLAQQATGVVFGDQHVQSLNTLLVSPATRASAMLHLFYASLNVVVEGWMSKAQATPRLQDPSIDGFLASEFPGILTHFRHSVMHPSALDDARAIKFSTAHSRLSQWAATLTDEFLRYFRDWKQTFPPRGHDES